MNGLLKKRHLPCITSAEHYRKVFCFPVSEYYKRLGFDFSLEPFEVLAKEFIDEYRENTFHIRLYPGALDTLKMVKDHGISQVVLSASELPSLIGQLEFTGVKHYFDDILGLDNFYAKSKLDIGTSWIKLNSIDPSKVLLIGDTLHDYEVAKELSCDCVMIADGHQGMEQLSKTVSCAILPHLSDLKQILGTI